MSQAKLRADFMDTDAAIREIITARPNRYGDLLPAGLVVRWGEPEASVFRTSAAWKWDVFVRADWLHTVHEEGISLVDGFLVLHAQESPRRVECEAAWLAVVAVPIDVPGDLKRDIELRNTCIVRWQGQVHCGKSQAQALAQCQQDYTDALLINEEGNPII
jgi:hypothetical protein